MPRSVGKHSDAVRHLRALRRDAALRRDRGVFLAEGLRLIREALDSGARIESAIVSPRLGERESGRVLLRRLEDAGVPLLEASDEVVAGLQDARSPQPVAAVIGRPRHDLAAMLDPTGSPPLVVVADGIQDPGNLGGLVRTAAASGATGVIVCGTGADPYHPRAARATTGALFRVPLVELETDAVLDALRSATIAIVGADPHTGSDYRATDFTRPMALFLGSEAHGLDPGIAARLDARVRIPLSHDVESLSVGAAAAALLFEAARQRAR